MRTSFRVIGLFLAPIALGTACGDRVVEVPPLGEVLVIIDTDMPVPRIVSRLRIDLYTATPAHTWYASRDSARSKATDFPTSFGVYLPDNSQAQDVLVRLRAYPEGEVRDYRGERYAARPSVPSSLTAVPLPEPTDQPRLLLEDGVDATPPTEPQPLLTIDRLLRIRVHPRQRSAARVVLRGSCVGVMADVASEKTCTETEGQLTVVRDEPTSLDTALPSRSLSKTFDFAEKCTLQTRSASRSADGTPLFDDEVCVDGAMFIFGNDSGFGNGDGATLPKRIAVLPPFRMDRYEVTVGRWRDALARGFRPRSNPEANDAEIPRGGVDLADLAACTWSTRPIGREDYPLLCLDWTSARAFCQWAGGELPTEAQWEYVTTTAGRPYPTPFPWGGTAFEAAQCSQAVFGRGPYPFDNECNLDFQQFGALPVDARAGERGDVSLGLGIVGLAGGAGELMLDTFASLSSDCWSSQPLRSPACVVEGANRHVFRGGSWSDPKVTVYAARRLPLSVEARSAQVGFRCVR